MSLAIVLAAILVPGLLCITGLLWLVWRDSKAVTDQTDEAGA